MVVHTYISELRKWRQKSQDSSDMEPKHVCKGVRVLVVKSDEGKNFLQKVVL